MKKIVRDHNPENGVGLIVMDSLDADHAVSVDPERYSIEAAQSVHVPLTLEQRLDRIERRLGPETPEEIEHRKRRDQELADRAAEARPAPKQGEQEEVID